MDKRTFGLLTASLIVSAAGLAPADDGSTATDSSVVRNPRIWAGFAGGPARVSVAHEQAVGPLTLDTPRFVFSGGDGRSFQFYGQCAVAVGEDVVVALGYETDFLGQRLPDAGGPQDPTDPGHPDGDASTNHTMDEGDNAGRPMPDHMIQPGGVDTLVAFSRLDGSLVWAVEVPRTMLESWSAPVIDTLHGTVLVATGSSLSAFRIEDGSPAWSADLGRLAINASPAVTDDLPGRNRMLITDHSYTSDAPGRLICINADPYHASINPYEPGDVVWTVSLAGETSGNTPAYRDGVVYVSTATGGAAWDQGTIRAFRADSDTEPAALWTYEHNTPAGFYAGVAVRDGAVYASSYASQGGQFAAETIKLDAADGRRLWSVKTNPTDTTPVPLGNGKVLVSGGLPNGSELAALGSMPSVQMLAETPTGQAVRLWDTAASTHQDTNQNGRWDAGEPFLSLGGWTIQPVVMHANGKAYAYVGRSPDTAQWGAFGPSDGIAMIDLSRQPWQPGFVVDWGEGCGASPGLTGAELYTVGETGVYAFGAPQLPLSLIVRLWTDGRLPDLNGDGRVNLHDLQLATQYALDG